ncbi:acyltransferase family protein [Arthrobacter castelli]|uniref:acyltransferase family protein n=1 Tax=Arthrobacter castelli TaxID=271431 RepID=UPI00042A3E6A|nr:acyltransferase family protein [Arthrobacter castelli]
MTASAEVPAKPQPASQPAAPSGPRKDIQGLRALAVALVVLFHLWPGKISGGYIGVDVFLVISGYLITAHLLKKPPRTGHDLWKFWARRLRRLLPAALVVLAVTAVAVRLVAPSTLWAEISKQIIASAIYVQNWALAAGSVNYMESDAMESPVQHFWSLSVEEQFYLVWPLLILAVAWVVARRRSRAGAGRDPEAENLANIRLARTVIGAVVVISLAFSIWFTAIEPASAYFITPTRIWELAAGGFIATFATMSARNPNSRVGVVLSWAGIAAVFAAAYWYTSATPFPGVAALLPVAGTAVVILAGSDHPLSPTGFLKHGPIQWLGDVSYSVYLWHWPLIALLPYVSNGSLGMLDKAVILVATFVLAGLSKVHVEDRFRFAKPHAPLRQSYQFAAIGMIAVVLLGSLQWTEAEVRKEAAEQELAAVEDKKTPCLGAAALVKGPPECEVDPDGKVVPEPELAKTDKADINEEKCFPEGRYDKKLSCSFGSGDTEIALVGNSHARHWLPALRELADEKGWTIDTYIISKCTATDAKQQFDTEKKSQDCYEWGQWAQEQTKGDKYDLVITSERQSAPIVGHSLADSGPAAVEGYESYLKEWAKAGTNVLAIKDPTYPGIDVPECVAKNPENQTACSGSSQDWKVHSDPLIQAVKNIDRKNINHTSFDDLVCAPDRCRGVNGGVITYFDSSHLSATYVETMAPYMAKTFEKALQR